jgi:hypothetical protein
LDPEVSSPPLSLSLSSPPPPLLLPPRGLPARAPGSLCARPCGAPAWPPRAPPGGALTRPLPRGPRVAPRRRSTWPPGVSSRGPHTPPPPGALPRAAPWWPPGSGRWQPLARATARPGGSPGLTPARPTSRPCAPLCGPTTRPTRPCPVAPRPGSPCACLGVASRALGARSPSARGDRTSV